MSPDVNLKAAWPCAKPGRKNAGPGRESCDPLGAKQVANYTGRPALDAFRYYEALARVYLRGPNPEIQKKMRPPLRKAGRRYSEAQHFAHDPLCAACLLPIIEMSGKSLGAKQLAGLLEATECGRDPLCRDHFLYKLKIGCVA